MTVAAVAAAVTIRFWREARPRPSVDRRGLCNSGPSGRETIVPPSVAKYPLLDTTVVSYRVDKLHAKVMKLGSKQHEVGHKLISRG